MNYKITFSFGKNWQKFLKSLNETRLKNAELSIIEFLGLKNLQDKTFLDIGCGSGLFSYAAFRLGAKRIVSFDVDPFSVTCCKYLRKKANSPNNWEVYEGSIIDNSFISKLGKFDVVYAWGVLHHTGKMWEAIENSAKLVDKGGIYYITIYNKVEGWRQYGKMMGSNFWLRVKLRYNRFPRIGKYILEPLYVLYYFATHLIRLRNPVTEIKNYKLRRGMNWRTDVTDWLGGYPYEFAPVDYVLKFIMANFPKFNLVNIRSSGHTLGNNWYLFKNDEK